MFQYLDKSDLIPKVFSAILSYVNERETVLQALRHVLATDIPRDRVSAKTTLNTVTAGKKPCM